MSVSNSNTQVDVLCDAGMRVTGKENQTYKKLLTIRSYCGKM